jgi:hypothetical protein
MRRYARMETAHTQWGCHGNQPLVEDASVRPLAPSPAFQLAQQIISVIFFIYSTEIK